MNNAISLTNAEVEFIMNRLLVLSALLKTSAKHSPAYIAEELAATNAAEDLFFAKAMKAEAAEKTRKLLADKSIPFCTWR